MSSSLTDRDAAPGSIEVAMPQMGVSVAEGTIIEWLKRPGDWVESDEVVCVVTTDKVDVEIPSPASGRLERILVEAGDTVAVGTPLAAIDAGARPGEAHREEDTASPAAPPAPAAEDAPDRSRFYSPVVRRMADEHGIDLADVTGTGIGGRVRKRDLLAAIAEGTNGGHSEGRPLHTESPYKPEPEPGGVATHDRGLPPGADDADAAADRRSHDREPAHRCALHDHRRGRPRAGWSPREPLGARKWRPAAYR